MEQEFERPELQPDPELQPGGIARPGPGERVPMPAGPGTARRQAGANRYNGLVLAAAAILAAGLAGAIVFRGDLRHAGQALPAQPPAVQVVVKTPSKAPPALPAPAARVQPPSELPSLVTSGNPVETASPAPGGLSSPMPFFNSEDEQVVPRVSALQPYGAAAEPGRQAVSARPVLPAANRLVPRLQPAGGRTAAVPRAGGGLAALPASGPCPTCDSAVPGTKTDATLQGGESFVQHEVSTVYTGLCDGKYVYEYANLTTNKTIGMKVLTSGGESWSFTLRPGEKTNIKSSTEFSGGNFENIRLSEVMN